MPRVTLQVARRADLPLIQGWFHDEATRRFLGGPGWPALMFDLLERPLGEFRGMRETGRHRWLAWDDGRAVGWIDSGTYDRWATWEGGAGGRGVVSSIAVPSACLGYVVDPALRGQGYATSMIEAVLERPELSEIELFVAGIQPENVASVRAATSAGFVPLDPEPDWEGFVYWARHR
ncbi:MAG TPA: GNAT family N-acetyltransferase [Acidimicrobiales bacterium]|nr:GNAT family N-acetyltransferase [Acidimicrobiales bacterium]